jgi:hypothetical protein
LLSIIFICSFPSALTLAELDHPSLYVITMLFFLSAGKPAVSGHPDVTLDQVWALNFVSCSSSIEAQASDEELEDKLEKFTGEAKYHRYLLFLHRTKQETWDLDLK